MVATQFEIRIPNEDLASLNVRLDHTRWPGPAPGEAWSYGTDLEYLKELTTYWRTEFNWRRQERLLNSHPQYMCPCDARGHRIDVHYVHVRGRGPRPLPLVLTHGWPSCFFEMYKMIPLLTNPAAHGGDERDAFDVIIPSLPGFGYSSAPERPGCDIETIGELWVALMRSLGYERFGAHGGDWGSHVTLGMGRSCPGNLIGLHVNYVPGAWRPSVGKDDPPLAEAELSAIRDRERWESECGAYAHVHGTRPQTVAYALTDSPVGLASWMLDLFRGISDCGGRVDNAISKDEMLTIISIYWFTRSIASSIRLYREVRTSKQFTWEPEKRIAVPCGIARFPVEIARQPRALVERFMNVVHWTEMPSGGHFAPLEEPQLLAEDLRTFFHPLR